VDSPGSQQGLDQKHAAQLLFAFAEATVPKLTVILRKAYGEAYSVMGSKHLRADLNLAWPTAEVLVAEPEAAVNILHRRELESTIRHAEAVMPQGVTLSEQQKLEILAEIRKERMDEYSRHFASPYLAAERGYVDAVIRPSETRRRLNFALDRLSTKRDSTPMRKHGNIPL
jgi:propionyl-CoA carboxylase beta chain